MIQFKDLTPWLKVAIIGGMISFFSTIIMLTITISNIIMGTFF